MSLSKRKPKKKSTKKPSDSKYKLSRGNPFNIDPASVKWESFGSNSETSLKEGEVIRRKTSSGYEYGIADGGFGMSPDTIGRAIYVRTMTNILSGSGHVLTPANDRYLYDDPKKAGIARWNRGEDKIERVYRGTGKSPKELGTLKTARAIAASKKSTKRSQLVGRDQKMYDATVKRLKAKPSVHNFQTYLTITTKARIRNIKVGKKRKDGTRFARWEQQKSDGTWFNASTSYLTDEGYPDGW